MFFKNSSAMKINARQNNTHIFYVIFFKLKRTAQKKKEIFLPDVQYFFFYDGGIKCWNGWGKILIFFISQTIKYSSRSAWHKCFHLINIRKYKKINKNFIIFKNFFNLMNQSFCTTKIKNKLQSGIWFIVYSISNEKIIYLQ